MNPRPSQVSVIDPINPAIERVRDVLFRPFDLGRWFVIGFCAWLAELGRGGGGNSGGDDDGGGVRVNDLPGQARHFFEEVKDYVAANSDWLIPVSVVVIMVVIVIALFVVWLSSRGRFMFLHCVAQNKAEVKVPWCQYEMHAYSLFLFRIAVGIIGFLIFASFIAVGVVLALFLKDSPALVLGMVALGFILIVPVVIFGVITKFTKDFVVPIMYLHTTRCTQAWQILLGVLSANKGRFALYILFQIVIGLAIGTLIVILGCLTCGCACCFFGFPYIGTVALLPFLVFMRAYSLYYLAQYGPEFYAFARDPQPTEPMAEAQGQRP